MSKAQKGDRKSGDRTLLRRYDHEMTDAFGNLVRFVLLLASVMMSSAFSRWSRVSSSARCSLPMNIGDNPYRWHPREGSTPDEAARRSRDATGGAYGTGASPDDPLPVSGTSHGCFGVTGAQATSLTRPFAGSGLQWNTLVFF